MSNGIKYILFSFGVLLLLIIGIVVFNRSSSQPASTSGRKPIVLNDYATNNNAAMVYTVDGPIVALENHRTTQITITPISRNLTVFTGYQHNVLQSKTYNNDTQAYQQFLGALKRAAYTQERPLAKNIKFEAICPTGSRTTYQITNGSKDVMNLWIASCTTGSFGGNTVLTNTLFKTQIPDYANLTNSVNLGTTGSSGLL